MAIFFLYLDFLEELKKEREKCQASESRAQDLEVQLTKLQKDMDKVLSELEGVRTAAAVSEANKQEEIRSVAANYQQEVASLQQLLKGALFFHLENFYNSPSFYDFILKGRYVLFIFM